MPKIYAKPDNLNDRNREFEQVPLQHNVFINSVPKCGTHLTRNIFRMFVPVEQQYHQDFVQLPTLRNNLAAFDNQHPKLSWGHLLFSDDAAIALKNTRQLLIVRDPYDWVLARARFFLSDTFQGGMEHLKGGKVSIEQMLNMMIFGIYQKAPTLNEIFTHNGVAWLGTGVQLVRYEDLVKHLKNIDSPDAFAFFSNLLAPLGFNQLPDDWKQRVLIGADRKQSGTARENLRGLETTFPDTLPDEQKRLVDYAAPGLRKLLGYEN